VKALEAPLPLAAVPAATAAPSVVDAVKELARADAYQAWLQGQEAKVLNSTICAGDDVPSPTPVELADYLPFLALAG
jgi:hypothetical protein